MNGKRLLALSVACLCYFYSFSQFSSPKAKVQGWHLLDEQKDGYMGISLQKAYDLLKGRKNTTVIVAVIDSGIDTAQEDLKPNLWRNPGEINGNGIDDDKNGYVDDVYGWNFCGSKDGENLVRNSYEIARVYHGWKKEFEGKPTKDLSVEKKFLYRQWARAAALINKDYDEAMKEKPDIDQMKHAMQLTSQIITDTLAVKEFTIKEIQPLLKSSDENILMAERLWNELFTQNGDSAKKNTAFLEEITRYSDQLDAKVDRKLKAPEDWRGQLTKDNYTDINDRFYGNNNLKIGSGHHGTMVAGTIGAVRNNGIGVDGIADNVRIMAIRAMPGGDEHDKDIALAIRYAVDNGAKIINMSFGKPVSPYKQFVDDAVRYAASKGVLLVHGSGNNGQDITTNVFYPTATYINGKKANNLINVGASGDPSISSLAAPFSNYSSKEVDIFAPGVYIHSTASSNSYQDADGTSLACPVVSGVAALLKSYFPDLTPAQIISILTTSGKPIDTETIEPGTENTKVKFSSLSSSGRIVNAYEAVKLALSREKK